MDRDKSSILEPHEMKGNVMLRSDLGRYISPKLFLKNFASMLKLKRDNNMEVGISFEEFVYLVNQSAPNKSPRTRDRDSARSGSATRSPVAEKIAVQRYSDEMIHQLLCASLSTDRESLSSFTPDQEKLNNAVLRSPSNYASVPPQQNAESQITLVAEPVVNEVEAHVVDSASVQSKLYDPKTTYKARSERIREENLKRRKLLINY